MLHAHFSQKCGEMSASRSAEHSRHCTARWLQPASSVQLQGVLLSPAEFCLQCCPNVPLLHITRTARAGQTCGCETRQSLSKHVCLSATRRAAEDLITYCPTRLGALSTCRAAGVDHTFGYHRVEVLGGMLSVLIIWVVTGVLVFEAVQRCRHPEDVDGKIMFILAVSGDRERPGVALHGC